MHIDSAEGLVASYGRASSNVRDSMNALAPLVTRANGLLGRANANTAMSGPALVLHHLSNDLTTEQQDVAWRVDWMKSTDAQPLGLTGRVQAFVPANIEAGFAAHQLTPEQIETARRLIDDGVSFTDAVEAAQTEDPQAFLDAQRLAELNEEIERWLERGNLQIAASLQAERQEILDSYLASDEPIPEVFLEVLLQTLTPEEAAAIEGQYPGTLDIGYLNDVIADHYANYLPGDPVDPGIEHLRDLRDALVAGYAEDHDGPLDNRTAAFAQEHDVSYREAEIFLAAPAIERLNQQALDDPTPQGTQAALDQRNALILEIVDGDEELAAAIGLYLSLGYSFVDATRVLHTEEQRNGDLDGTLSSERRLDFVPEAGIGANAGADTAIEALNHTADPNRLAQDEFEIVYLDNGQAILILPGVTDLSSTIGAAVTGNVDGVVDGVGWDPNSHTARDTFQAATDSLHTASIDDNVYAQLVAEFIEEEIRTGNLAQGANIMIVGHSFGADTALDLSSDPTFNGSTVNVTHVVAAAYHSEPQLDSVQGDTQVAVIQNVHDFAVIAEGVGVEDGNPAAGAIVGAVVEGGEAGTNLGIDGVNGVAEGGAEVLEQGVEGLAGIGNFLIPGGDPFPTDIEVDAPDIPDVNFTEPRITQVTDDIVVSEFYGGFGTDGGHHQDRYSEHIETSGVPELDDFFESVAEAGYTGEGEAHAVDVTVPADRRN